MKYLLYAFVGLCAVWIMWYVSGGPLREDRDKPYIGVTGDGFEYSNKVDTGLDRVIK